MVSRGVGCTTAIVEASWKVRAHTSESCARCPLAGLGDACQRGPEWLGRQRLVVSGAGHASTTFHNPLVAISDMLSKSMASADRITLRCGARVLCHALGGRLFGGNGTSVLPSDVVVALERLEEGTAACGADVAPLACVSRSDGRSLTRR